MTPQNLRRASLTVLVGSVLGFGVNLLLTPVLSRIYSPDEFGLFSTVLAVGTTMVGISTFRLEVRAQSAVDADSRQLLALSLASALAWSLVASVVGVGVVLWGAHPAWCAVGLITLTGSLQLIGTAVLARSRAYKRLALANFVQGAGTALLQSGLGLWRASWAALAAGFAVPRLIWVLASRGQGPRAKEPSLRNLSQTWREHRRYALTAGSSAGINSLAGQSLILLAAFSYGGAAAGVLAMALRLLVAPLGIVGQAAAAAAVGEIGRRVREGEPSFGLLRGGVRDLLLVGLIPCGLAVALGPSLVPVVLGQEWRTAGVAVAALAPGALLQLAVAPYSQIMNLAGSSSTLLRWDGLRLLLLPVSIGVPAMLGADLEASLWVYSAAQVLLYMGLYRMLSRTLRRGPQMPADQPAAS